MTPLTLSPRDFSRRSRTPCSCATTPALPNPCRLSRSKCSGVRADEKRSEFRFPAHPKPLAQPSNLEPGKTHKRRTRLPQSVMGSTLRLLCCLALTTSACLNSQGIDVIVFQGPNNKGMSGAPLISNRTGRVVGIVTRRLVGISDKLDDIRKGAAQAFGIDSIKRS
jgi:hypothetical protein